MTAPMQSMSTKEQHAIRANTALAERVAKWKLIRLAAAIALTIGGLLLSIVMRRVVESAPCFLLAGVAWMMYLESRDHHQEAVAHTWKSLTPRVDDVIRQSVEAPPHRRRVAG